MRRALLSILLVIIPVRAASGDEHGLGHHWTRQEYWQEIRCQFVVMLCIIAAVALREVIVYIRRPRR